MNPLLIRGWLGTCKYVIISVRPQFYEVISTLELQLSAHILSSLCDMHQWFIEWVIGDSIIKFLVTQS